MPPSITYWHRLEPDSRSQSVLHGLSAQIRDPAWLLARQWQMGEFQGEDAASPAFIQLVTNTSKIQAFQTNGIVLPIGDVPLEVLSQSEAFTPDLALRTEIGQTFELLLSAHTVEETLVDIINTFRQAFPLRIFPDTRPTEMFTLDGDFASTLNNGQLPQDLYASWPDSISTQLTVWTNLADQEWIITDLANGQQYALLQPSPQRFTVYWLLDREILPFLRMCAGRSIDGITLLRQEDPIPSSITGDAREAAQDAVAELREWYGDIVGNANSDAPSWKPDRLEFQLDVFAASPDVQGNFVRLRTQPEKDGTFDWHTLDFVEDNATLNDITPLPIQRNEIYVQPNRLVFRGMPNVRWWEFENNRTDFGAIEPEKRDLARMLLMDFMLITGNDWFMIPYTQAVGSIAWVERLIVHDTFDGKTLIEPATEDKITQRNERWSMFTHSVTGQPGRLSSFFVLPGTVGSAAQTGNFIEDVRFLRDEMANLVWAIEEYTENSVGLPWGGHEYDLAAKPARPPAAPTTNSGTPPLHYLVQTPVPSHWIPFTAIKLDDEVHGRVLLEITTLLDESSHIPRGRILRPSNIQHAYRLWEEEVPREGVRLQRMPMRSRWSNGQTHVWVTRRKSVMTEEASSALRFDQITTENSS